MSTDPSDIEEDWRIEAEARLAQVKRGEARLIPGDEVFARIRLQVYSGFSDSSPKGQTS
jgi:Putative addiction module component